MQHVVYWSHSGTLSAGTRIFLLSSRQLACSGFTKFFKEFHVAELCDPIPTRCYIGPNIKRPGCGLQYAGEKKGAIYKVIDGWASPIRREDPKNYVV